eukprot:1328949-Amorphochlora_amoeboformis.AAC.1
MQTYRHHIQTSNYSEIAQLWGIFTNGIEFGRAMIAGWSSWHARWPTHLFVRQHGAGFGQFVDGGRPETREKVDAAPFDEIDDSVAQNSGYRHVDDAEKPFERFLQQKPSPFISPSDVGKH